MGIGVGVPLAVIVIGLLIWIGLILRKRRVNRTEPAMQSEAILGFQIKAELPAFQPTHVGVARGSSALGELP